MERSKLKKAIIFDCDNTLWKGVIGEDVIHPDIELQNDIIFLARRGVIVGLCSKNNEADVMEALRTQPLEEQYISVRRINWKDKVSNLKEIAEELNIGLDAIVFVDDSEFEINLIREQLPKVMAIYPKALMWNVIEHFDLTGDFTKTQQYRENYQRAKAKEYFTDINDYLASLDMVLTITLNHEPHIPRIAEMTQKTNQFNLTTTRYTEDEIREIMSRLNIFTLSVSDKFGDNGITGVCITSNCTIMELMLSCRILGRGIEYAFIDHVINHLKDRGCKHICGIYKPTERNGQVAGFYPSLGFAHIRTIEKKKIYYIDTDEYKPKAQKHFRYE